MITEGSVKIAKPVEEVFEYTTREVVAWSSIVVEDEVIEPGPGGEGDVGTTFRTVTEEGGRRMEFAGVVTKNDPPKAHTVIMKGRQFDIEAAYTFEDLGTSALVRQVSDVRPKGFMKVFFALFGWMMKKSGCDAQQKELERLKRLAEAR